MEAKAKVWILKNQLGRRNLEPSQRAILMATRDGLVKEIEAKAKDRKHTGLKQYQEKTVPLLPGEREEKGETDKVLGDMAGVGKETMRLARKIAKEGTAEQKRKIIAGESSVYKEAKKLPPKHGAKQKPGKRKIR